MPRGPWPCLSDPWVLIWNYHNRTNYHDQSLIIWRFISVGVYFLSKIMMGFWLGYISYLKLCGFFSHIYLVDPPPPQYIWLIICLFDQFWLLLFVLKKILSKTAQGIFKISDCILFLDFDCCQLYWNVMDFCPMWIPFSFTCKKFYPKLFKTSFNFINFWHLIIMLDFKYFPYFPVFSSFSSLTNWTFHAFSKQLIISFVQKLMNLPKNI